MLQLLRRFPPAAAPRILGRAAVNVRIRMLTSASIGMIPVSV